MAVKYQGHMETKEKEDVAPFTETELGYIKEVEDYIDEEIKKKVNTSNKEVWIFLYIGNFTTRVDGRSKYPYMTNARQKHLFDELMRRYDEAGWKHDFHIDDGLDGPNMSGSDYLILKGK